MGQCCYAYFCFSCFVLSIARKIDESCISCCCVPGALVVYCMKIRSILRIQGDSCDDYCAVTCCPCCAAVQMRNELIERGLG
ncbi:unnamed protein product [Rotaria socialis]|uniref:Uncharacterized protein n=1 Tax=Rotaria socialis TaxID=392032 RepID=A0A818G5I1_9BILA|nr:unnamed protein product [Rotaria socialis]CAF3486298.1 unnamed protein product [Rotaria socialis]CAF3743304.1 unnamed protein product [Rotaria socialis]